MNIDFDFVSKNLLNSGMKEHEHFENIKQIQSFYTTHRSELGFFNKSLVSSYTLFYMLTNMAKGDYALSCLTKEWRRKILNSHIVDIGCGPGTYAWSFLQHNKSLSYLGIDKNPIMLDAAKKIKSKLGADFDDLAFKENYAGLNEREGTESTLFFGQSFNEMNEADVNKIVRAINPEHIMIIEAGTKDQFDKLIDWRKKLSSYHPIFPCSSDNLSCPMDKDDWCHQKFKVSLDPALERFGQKVKIDRRNQSLIFHLYSKASSLSEFRVIQFLKETKFSYDYIVCKNNELFKVEILKKKNPFKRKEMQKSFTAGKSISFEIIKKIAENHLRVQLSQ